MTAMANFARVAGEGIMTEWGPRAESDTIVSDVPNLC